MELHSTDISQEVYLKRCASTDISQEVHFKSLRISRVFGSGHAAGAPIVDVDGRSRPIVRHIVGEVGVARYGLEERCTLLAPHAESVEVVA